MQSPLLLGELVVVALKAGGRKQDPFCVFRISGQVKTTRIDHGGGAYPVWDDQVNIQLGQGQQHLLNVQIFDRDMNPNHFMGESNIDLAKVLREREHDGYFPLNLRGQPAGEIYLEMTFYPWVGFKDLDRS
ncbi:C2 domain-containing protein [Sporodiniella umbellata]|nr:C2 domain-containing protein [Sporodiniella umbellata]